jgi:phosphatidylserine/phosphatidylglycerophosphate/cardiolipin synthase-like enzyme
MDPFMNAQESNGLGVKLWRGERMCLVGMDVEQPEPDFVGFSIEVRSPGNSSFLPLRNRLNFSYKQAVGKAVNGYRNFPSTEAPFQKYRWIHFPYNPRGGNYVYRVTKQHMPSDGKLVAGTSVTLDIPLDPVIYDNYLDVGFTRNFASSQAYADKYGNNSKVIPTKADQGLKFKKLTGDVYQWLGFEAYDMMFAFLDEVASDKSMTLDLFAYDLNEKDIVSRLVKMKSRVRAIIDDSGSHGKSNSAESQAAGELLPASVRRMHFHNLQHNKVMIARRNGQPVKVLFGSTNFSFRGLYIQANNALVFHSNEAAGLFGDAFDLAFKDPKSFYADPISKQWHLVQESGKPAATFCFSPHKASNLSLSPVSAAIEQATSSVLFAISFLSQMSKTAPVRQAIDRLMDKRLFSYGISDREGGLHVRKPDGSVGLVDFSYLAKNVPEPFKSEWSGGAGIHEHHKFVVTDFSLPTAKVFTGSSNLSPSGEQGNGDNLVMIADPRVATSYAIEALRIFDHLHFRTVMQDVLGDGKNKNAKNGKKGAGKKSPAKKATLALQKPKAISGEKTAWFEKYYEEGSVAENDRKLFSH